MTEDTSECGLGKFAGWTLPPQMEHDELTVTTSGQQSSIAPALGKRLTIHRIFMTCKISVALSTTVRCTIAFGTGGVSDSTKILMSNMHTKGDSCNAMWTPSLNLLGDVDEPITLTNHVFSGGAVTIRIVVYYTES